MTGQEDEELFNLAMRDTADPDARVKILAYRVAVIAREKEQLEMRVAKMEKSFNMGAGVLLVLPIVGSIVGMLLAFGKELFKPWTGGSH